MSRSKNPAILIAVLVALGLVGAGLYLLLKDTTNPKLALNPETRHIGPNRALSLNASDPGSGLKNILVRAIQGQKQVVILEKQYPAMETHAAEQFTLADAKLTDGPFTLEVTAADGSLAGFGKGNVSTLTREMILDSVKPGISVLSTAHNIRHGGAACVVYTVSEDTGNSGVQVGDVFFPGYRQENGNYYCLFAYPWYMDKNTFQPRLTASDEAGNEAARSFGFHLLEREFKSDSLNLSENFINSKPPEF